MAHDFVNFHFQVNDLIPVPAFAKLSMKLCDWLMLRNCPWIRTHHYARGELVAKQLLVLSQLVYFQEKVIRRNTKIGFAKR
jgi:hypothetical protein